MSKNNFLRWIDLVKRWSQTHRCDWFMGPSGFCGGGISWLGIDPLEERWPDEKSLAGLSEFFNHWPGPISGLIPFDWGRQRFRGHKDRSLVPPARFRRYRGGWMFHHEEGLLQPFGELPQEPSGFIDDQGEATTGPSGKIVSFPQHEAFVQAVAQAKMAIGQGAYYQVNLTGAFSWQLSHHLSPWALFWLLYERFPAAAAGGFALEDGLWISLSPETLVRRRNSMVWTEPIKGTRPLKHGSSAEAAELASSEKERAELSMIVDLLRNDFAEVCLPGSVCVTHHLETFSVGRLWQMFSRISGQLLPDLGDERLLWSLFPPGSVTGCPKRAALLAIDTLENYPRGYYCGSMISRPYPNHLDASVSIRSGFATKTTFQYYAGSGIVMDSDPEEEYRETLSKASHIALALEGRIPW